MPTKRSSDNVPAPALKGEKRASPLTFAVLGVVLVTAAILGISNIWSAKSSSDTPKAEVSSTPAAMPDSIKELIEQVSKHIVVMQDEEPKVATVQDAEMLRSQNPVFYRDVQNGDRLLAWSDKAVLYSASKDVILAVMPIMANDAATTTGAANETSAEATSMSQAESAKQNEAVTIEVRNGSTVRGAAKSLSDKLVEAGLKTLPPTDAAGRDHEKTIIIKISEQDFSAQLESLQELVGAEVASMPEREKASTADFLIIVGADFLNE